MEATICTLYENSFCAIKDFRCNCRSCTTSKAEYQDCFSLCYIRKGTFRFKAFNGELDSYHGLTLINKPGFEHRVAHLHTVPDQCTIFSFSHAFFEEWIADHKRALNRFLEKPDVASALVQNTVAIDHLHFMILNEIRSARKQALLLDTLLIQFITAIFEEKEKMEFHQLSSTRAAKLNVVEDAKDYLLRNYADNISLTELAEHVGMSTFYFARTFKSLTSYSPYDYLLRFRMLRAGHLLKSTTASVQDVCYHVGFHDAFNFSTAFKRFYGIAPSDFRFSKI